MSSIRKVRWGVIGTAGIAVRVVIPAIQSSRNGQVMAIASRDLAKAQQAARDLNIPRAYGSYEALVQDPEVDAVYIPLPNSLHREWTIRAAERGKHVLCEKPLAVTPAECDEMVEACARRGVHLMEAFMYRFHPQTVKVEELIQQGVVGEVRMVRSAFTFPLSRADDIRLRKDLGGGSVMDVGCYCIDVARWVFQDEPTHVTAAAVFGADSDVDEMLGAVLRFPGDRLAVFDCGLRTNRREWYEVVGTQAAIQVPVAFIPRDLDADIRIARGREQEIIRIPGTSEYRLMVEHFADCVTTGAAPRLAPSDAHANLRVVQAVLESARRNQPVRP
jgi:xylose dehydrogenase (NAD/NADP)